MALQEFFIATVPHPEWNRAHAVWGKVSDTWPMCWLYRFRCMLGACAPKHTFVAGMQVDDFAVVDMVPFEPSFTRCVHRSYATCRLLM